MYRLSCTTRPELSILLSHHVLFTAFSTGLSIRRRVQKTHEMDVAITADNAHLLACAIFQTFFWLEVKHSRLPMNRGFDILLMAQKKPIT